MTPPAPIRLEPPIYWIPFEEDAQTPLVLQPPSGSSSVPPAPYSLPFPFSAPLSRFWSYQPTFSPSPRNKISPQEAMSLFEESLKISGYLPSDAELWLHALIQILNQVESLDVDFQHVPVNLGSNLCRFPEYTPRQERPEACTISIQPQTTAHVYGEVRPIRGSKESMITRFLVDFEPNVTYLPRALEIDGFSAVDPPDMEYDRSFKTKTSVRSMSGGDYSYENPLATKEPQKTPFGSVREPPPQGHRDMMIQFQAVEDGLFADLKTGFAHGHMPSVLGKPGLGAMLLWAFMPVVGLTWDDLYEDLDIRYNTVPRRLGDLVKIFEPYFDPDWRARIRHLAPYINPNTEYFGLYLDDHGQRLPFPKNIFEVMRINEKRKLEGKLPIGRQPIPEDPALIEKINEERARFGLPPIGRNRGGIIDWTLSALAKAPKRLKAMSNLPIGHTRIKMLTTTLKLPIGYVTIDEKTQIRAAYSIKPVEVKGKTEAHIGIQLSVSPLVLRDVSLKIGNYFLKAKELKVRKAIASIPSLPFDGATPESRPPMTFQLQGVEAVGLKFAEVREGFEVEMPSAKLGSLEVIKDGKDWKGTLHQLQGTGLKLKYQGGEFAVNEFSVPQINLAQVFQEGVPRFFSVRIPLVKSKIGLSLSHAESNTQLSIEGESKVENFRLYSEFQGDKTFIDSSLDLSGSITSAKVKHPKIGEVSFTTEQDGGFTRPISGHLAATLVRPRDPNMTVPPAQFDLDLTLPYVGFESKGRFQIPPGAARLQNGELKLNAHPNMTGSLKGKLEMKDGSYNGLEDEPFYLGRIILFPHLQKIHANGAFNLEILADGFRLRPLSDSAGPLSFGLDINGSQIIQEHDKSKTPGGRLPEAEVIRSRTVVDSAQVEVANLRDVEVRSFSFEDGVRRLVTKIDAGPLTAHHLQGESVLWVDLKIWGFVRGLFPKLGGGSGFLGKAPRRPSIAPLLAHLDATQRKAFEQLTGGEDFFHVGRVYFHRESEANWQAQLEELLFNIHEEGGRGQFGMGRLPEANRGEKNGISYRDLGRKPILTYIFLNDPKRGGCFIVDRWWPRMPGISCVR